ncbi:hypothetical protein HPP92_010479 [Vanilla planifolia]|uniref:Uncharacterized protein n=1 Tax=Vanilla planifolia TaxID=51239 RepID=A0A835V1G7_VANPL|nr:hypothetical protein HPP92_010479 [Vanilla planifolia]
MLVPFLKFPWILSTCKIPATLNFEASESSIASPLNERFNRTSLFLTCALLVSMELSFLLHVFHLCAICKGNATQLKKTADVRWICIIFWSPQHLLPYFKRWKLSWSYCAA